MLLHALNPYGFAWDRRVNEDNADINRNFVDFTHPPENEAYEALAAEIAPRDISPDAMREGQREAHGLSAKSTAPSRCRKRSPAASTNFPTESITAARARAGRRRC